MEFFTFKQLKQAFNLSPTLITTFIVSMLFGIIVYGFELTHFTVSLDETGTNYTQSLAMGRWMFVFLKLYIFPEPYIPFFTTLITLIFLAITAVIIVKSFQLTLTQSIIFSAFFIGLPQFAYQLEYAIISDTVSLGLILSAISFYLFITRKQNNIRFSYIIIVLCIASAMAIYQSLLFVPVTLYIAWLIHEVDSNNSYKKSVKETCLFFLLIVISALLSIIITKLIIYLGDVPTTDYADRFIGWKQAKEINQIPYLLNKFVNQFTFAYGLKLYLISLIPIAWLSYLAITKISIKNITILCLAICLFVSPFFICLIFGKPLPARTLLSLSIAMGLLFVIFLKKSNATKTVTIIATFIVITGTANSSKLFHSDYVTYETDKAIANKIYYSIQEKFPKFSPATPVYFRAPYLYENYAKITNGETFGASHFNVDDRDSTIRIVQLFQVANIAEINTPNQATIEKLDKLCLPSWPNKDSMQMVDGVLVVNLRKDLVRKHGQVCNAP